MVSGDSHELSTSVIETLRLFGGTVPTTATDPIYNTDTIDVLKLSEGGTGVLYALSIYDSQVAPFYNPQRMVNVASLGIGHNDYINGRSVADTYSGILEWVGKARATGFIAVVATVMSSGFVNDVWRGQLNTLIRDGAAANDYTVRDSGGDAVLGCDGCYSNLTYFDADQVHLNITGQVIKAQYMYDILYSLGFR